MRVLLANLPWHEKPEAGKPGWRGIRAGSRWPHTFQYYGGELVGGDMPVPFFLATAGAMLKQAGFTAQVRDSIALGESYEDFYAFVAAFQPDVIVVETSTPSLDHDLTVVQRLKEMRPQLRAVFCGIHFELEDERFFADHGVIDYVVYGEYEAPVTRLLTTLRDGGDLGAVANLLYRDGQKVVKTGEGALTELDGLPWPDRTDLPNGNYIDHGLGLERPQLQVYATRGCPFGCIFCVWPQVIYRSRRYRKRNPEDVVAEIEAHLRQYPYRSFYFDDDTFNVDLNYVRALARLLKERGLDRVPWGAMGRADLMTREALLELRAAGLQSMKYGVESADPKVLNDIGKRMSLEKVVEMVNFTRELGIKVHLTFTIGLPNDTAESIERTIDLACRMEAESLQFSIATPFPGTRMYALYERNGWITTKNWSDYDGAFKAVSRTETFSGEELEAYVALAYRRWAESKVRRAVGAPAFQAAFAEKVAASVQPGERVLLLQAANVNLTVALLELLNRLGYEAHVLTHQRFVAHFAPLLSPERMHVFEQTGDFRASLLGDWARALQSEFSFRAAVIPYTNPDGRNYEEVEQVALAAAPVIAAGVNMEGTIIR
ncbi:radical SAM protein [Heliobacterium gestii]|uniref:Radical SAM protein n=1 Tax=Heliomicrobium gestii TaxID=2699 RepID=A0A845L8Q3_HELGE|nr:radical SAM protein [Heliomicrobium gestii]MBM7866708.1 radical SAM superfamily enzyme YgiQ (UPF0313 family) [Heliomicrobium gestii]MZP43012.1 radical SAM protein [Heliomicrobium gestii]